MTYSVLLDASQCFYQHWGDAVQVSGGPFTLSADSRMVWIHVSFGLSGCFCFVFFCCFFGKGGGGGGLVWFVDVDNVV